MLNEFIAELSAYRGSGVFNPWGEQDQEHDRDEQGPKIRSNQLCAYLRERIGHARVLLLAEAMGYQGGHFSGIPMTSERILLNKLQTRGILASDVFQIAPCRTSRPELKPEGFTEPTATVVWGFVKHSGIDPRQLVLWNSFPWHPYQAHKGRLSNRTPSDTELRQGEKILRLLLQMGQFETIIAVGRKAAKVLEGFHIPCFEVRHPANGGAERFRRQMSQLWQNR